MSLNKLPVLPGFEHMCSYVCVVSGKVDVTVIEQLLDLFLLEGISS